MSKVDSAHKVLPEEAQGIIWLKKGKEITAKYRR